MQTIYNSIVAGWLLAFLFHTTDIYIYSMYNSLTCVRAYAFIRVPTSQHEIIPKTSPKKNLTRIHSHTQTHTRTQDGKLNLNGSLNDHSFYAR